MFINIAYYVKSGIYVGYKSGSSKSTVLNKRLSNFMDFMKLLMPTMQMVSP